ncbi:hypothetical protein C2G38_2183112 [Gigaspora rosea]|uniref:Uncharacterized protein n=1 Tax=Gigaspora rosea TaxID=44941 RepID=A0A397VDC7_9GLOM|nr:hypothetical protein C2G38_2183112 [Gigaspora rosea]
MFIQPWIVILSNFLYLISSECTNKISSWLFDLQTKQVHGSYLVKFTVPIVKETAVLRPRDIINCVHFEVGAANHIGSLRGKAIRSHKGVGFAYGEEQVGL